VHSSAPSVPPSSVPFSAGPGSPGGRFFARRWLRGLAGAALLALLAACASTSGPPAAGYYRVKDGDTLTRIARENGQSVDDLVRWNRLGSPDRISKGQLLRVRPPGQEGAAAKPAAGQGGGSAGPSRPAPAARPVRGISLVWPAQGTLASTYNGTSSRGITLVNAAGTPVVAAAAGTVEYASNGLRGYGNLVILRHAGGFLTIYAHNRKLLVKQGGRVTQGQRIAEMGNSDAGRVGLYFELRQNGQPVNPQGALPPR